MLMGGAWAAVCPPGSAPACLTAGVMITCLSENTLLIESCGSNQSKKGKMKPTLRREGSGNSEGVTRRAQVWCAIAGCGNKGTAEHKSNWAREGKTDTATF